MNALWRQPLEYWSSGGPLLVPLALVCFGIWFYFLRTRRRLLAVLDQGAGIEDCLASLAGQPPDASRETLQAAGGLFGSVLAGTMADAARGRKPAESFDERAAEPLGSLSRDLAVVAALTAVAPLLGLLGTVVGMIATFNAVAVAGNATAGVAAGISQALVTTQFGLVIAIPGVFGLARLHRLLKQVRAQLALFKTYLLLGLSAQKGAAA